MLRAAALLTAAVTASALAELTTFEKFVKGYQAPTIQKLGQQCTVPEAQKTCGGFACVNSTCVKCTTDAQCAATSPVFVCHVASGDCVMKHLDMWDLTHEESLAGILAFFVTSLAAVAGIGGGGMLVPLYILVSEFPPGLAVSMSQATIVGCASLKMLIQMTRSHPDGGPIIDYSCIMILTPMTLVGTMLGHMIGRVLPDWLRLALLVALLGYMLQRTLAKASKAAAADARAAATADETRGLAKDVERGDTAVPRNAALEAIRAKRFEQYPVDKLLFCAVVWAVLVALSYLKHDYVQCGTFNYWVVTAVIVGSMMFLTAVAGRTLIHRDEVAMSAGYERREDEVHWNSATTFNYPLMSVTAGIGASLLGIGGGMVLGILLFEMSHKIKPTVSSATAAMATALVATKASAEFYIYGELPLDYAVYFILVGCLGTCMGEGPIGAFIRYKNKSSWIVYALAGVIAGSLVALAFAGILNVYKTWVSGGSMGFGSLCKTE